MIAPPPLRVFSAGLMTETNSFSPIPTLYKDYVQTRGDGHPDSEDLTPFNSVMHEYRVLSREQGCHLSQSLNAWAMPGGPTKQRAYEMLRDEILRDLQNALPIDVVLLSLHGSMAAEHCTDTEGDLLQCIRKIVGPRAKIGAVLDLHCHVTPAMLEAATCLVIYKLYPHLDSRDRARDVFRITTAAAV